MLVNTRFESIWAHQGWEGWSSLKLRRNCFFMLCFLFFNEGHLHVTIGWYLDILIWYFLLYYALVFLSLLRVVLCGDWMVAGHSIRSFALIMLKFFSFSFFFVCVYLVIVNFNLEYIRSLSLYMRVFTLLVDWHSVALTLAWRIFCSNRCSFLLICRLGI